MCSKAHRDTPPVRGTIPRRGVSYTKDVTMKGRRTIVPVSIRLCSLTEDEIIKLSAALLTE